MKDFKDLKVWVTAHELTLQIYRVTGTFPKEELFGLVSQMRRSASSIAANITEGTGRRSDGEFARFLHIARGSASEVEYHLLLAHDLGLISHTDFGGLTRRADEVQRMLTSLIQQVQPKALNRTGLRKSAAS